MPLCSKQKAVTRHIIRAKAKQLAQQSPFISIYLTIKECKWSDKWLECFMRHNKLSNCRHTTIAQRLLEELESKKDEFLSYLLFHHMRY